MGDFDVALNIEDISRDIWNIKKQDEFKECVHEVEMSDVNQTGLHYTWNQRPKSSVRIVKKLDRSMANVEFIQEYVNCFAIFQPH